MQPEPAEVQACCEDLVLHVAGREDAGNAGLRGIAVAAGLGHQVAVVHFQLAGKDVGVRLVADGDEHAMHVDLGQRARLRVLDAQAGDAGVVAQYLVERAVPQDGDLAFLLLAGTACPA